MSDVTSDKARLLTELREYIGDCRRCKLCGTRTNIVFGEGNPDARVMFIGEGPGRDEDLQARPFVGRAGQLLTAIIEKGMNIGRADTYIANVVKCRPTIDLKFERDRPPEPDERDACGRFPFKADWYYQAGSNNHTWKSLNTVSTRYSPGITSIRGRWFSHNGIPVMPTYHPSYILRNRERAALLKRMYGRMSRWSSRNCEEIKRKRRNSRVLAQKGIRGPRMRRNSKPTFRAGFLRINNA